MVIDSLRERRRQGPPGLQAFEGERCRAHFTRQRRAQLREGCRLYRHRLSRGRRCSSRELPIASAWV